MLSSAVSESSSMIRFFFLVVFFLVVFVRFVALDFLFGTGELPQELSGLVGALRFL